MENPTHVDDSPEARAILEGQLRQCFGRVVYTHKTHEKCADILLQRFARIKMWQMILSGVTTGACLVTVFGDGKLAALLGAVISTSLLVLNAYTKHYNLGEIAQKHRQTGAEMWIIREKYLSLLTDLRMGGKPIDALRLERDELAEALHSVYSGAPSTTDTAYQKAQKALKEKEDMTFTDKEINCFLPRELHKGS